MVPNAVLDCALLSWNTFAAICRGSRNGSWGYGARPGAAVGSLIFRARMNNYHLYEEIGRGKYSQAAWTSIFPHIVVWGSCFFCCTSSLVLARPPPSSSFLPPSSSLTTTSLTQHLSQQHLSQQHHSDNIPHTTSCIQHHSHNISHNNISHTTHNITHTTSDAKGSDDKTSLREHPTHNVSHTTAHTQHLSQQHLTHNSTHTHNITHRRSTSRGRHSTLLLAKGSDVRPGVGWARFRGRRSTL